MNASRKNRRFLQIGHQLRLICTRLGLGAQMWSHGSLTSCHFSTGDVLASSPHTHTVYRRLSDVVNSPGSSTASTST